MTGSGLLGRPWVDRLIAAMAAVPFIYVLSYNLRHIELTIPRLALLFQLTLLVVTMLIRRAPVRVTPKPMYWLVAFVGSYYGFLTVTVSAAGRPMTPALVTDVISMVSVIWDVIARITLGRNIGFVPAQRQLVMKGPYRLVRHPIYTALFVGEIAVVLENYSLVNLLLSVIFIGLFVAKTIMEERFLSEDPEYAKYMQRVRHRWIPGII